MSKVKSDSSSSSDATTVKLVIQQCLSARLKLPDQLGELSIGAGMVVFVCFVGDGQEENAIKAAETVSKVKLCEEEETQDQAEVESKEKRTRSRRTSVLEKPGDILIVPQATLGGKLKAGGKNSSIQYHGNVDKETGQRLYKTFCESLEALSRHHPKTSEKGCKVRAGIYGEKQVLSVDTDGPYTHIFQI